MSASSVLSEDTKPIDVQRDVADDSCIEYPYIEIVPLTRDTDGPCTTECDSGDCFGQVKQENLPVVKQEPDDVCCIGFHIMVELYFVPMSEVVYILLLSFFDTETVTSQMA